MHKKRLLKLAELLQTVPKAKFNLNDWRRNPDRTKNGDIHDCGTVACAIGWACAIPEFIKDGLRFEQNSPTYKGEYSWTAVEKFFGISEKMAELLFSSFEYPANTGPGQVAARIINMVNE